MRAAGQGDYRAELSRVVQAATTTEDVLDGLRDFARDERFLVGLRTLSRAITGCW